VAQLIRGFRPRSRQGSGTGFAPRAFLKRFSTMTVATAPSHGPASIFDLIAKFLESCHFRAAADAVRAQCSEKEFVLEADFAKNFRSLVDGSSLLLSELESLAYTGQPPKAAEDEEAVLEQVVDGLLRKLMASGHSLSDDKLNSSIEEVLNTEKFRKLSMMEGALDKQLGVPGFENLGINDTDVQRYWEQIQKGSMMSPPKEASGEVFAQQQFMPAERTGDGTEAISAEQAAALVSDAPVDQLQPQPQAPQQATQLQPPAPSSHYQPRRHGGQAGADEEWDANDEYHDDDDPGYRIREIYEAELLAELSTKMTSGKTTVASEEKPRDPPRGEVVDELTSCTSPPKPPGSPPLPSATPGEDAASTQQAEVENITKATPEGLSSTAVEEQRSPSPTFGEQASTASFPPQAYGVTAGENEKQREQEAAEKQREEQLKLRRRVVKYAASGDAFYPVELDGVVYDSFGLRVVFERDKTGFEESKEFPIRMNSVVAARYQILEYLGSAAFSRAVQCLDLETNKMVCMKIIKNDKDFFDQSLDEIKLLKYINVNGDVDEHCVLRLYDYFYHKEHLIIVTELLRDNLYEFSKFNRECGDEPYFTLGRLQKIASQVLTALDYVHSLRLIHCDLKPENILIRSYSRCEIKVIDFGSSCFVDDHLSSYVQSRSYRAPEVMLGLPYDQKIDLWSLGCILAELWTGYVLFQNDSVQSLLARVLGIIGEFPYHLMTRGRYVPQYFTQDGQLYQEIEGPSCPDRGRRLHLLVPKKTSLQQRMRTDSTEFLDFMTRLLQLDPTKRPTAREALEHPWLTQCKYSDGL